MLDNIREALKYIPVSALTREEWVRVGMGLKEEGYDVSVWDEWSEADARYHSGECERLWNGFTGSGVAGGTIVQMAKERGFDPKTAGCLDWDAVIDGDYESYNAPEEWHPVDELITYISTLFDRNDIVGYVTGDVMQRDNKWMPMRGNYTKTAGAVIDELEKCKRKYDGDITYAVGDYKQEAGAWFRVNPLDGMGAKNENVTKFKYALVESDDMAIEQQEAKLRELNLPIATLVYSGGKSLHALVKIDAKDKKEYSNRVTFLYNYLAENGITVDQQNRNPSRLTRCPGVMRNGKRQYLVDTNIGYRTWQEWTDSINAEVPDGQPLLTYSLKDYDGKPIPEPMPEIINGVLRQGQKMYLTGGSKTSKTFMLIELGLAIATGTKWLGMSCKQGKVLYLNMEISPNDFLRRVKDTVDAMGLSMTDNFDIWDGRGKIETSKNIHPLDVLIPDVVATIKQNKYDVVILDPIYKVMLGDENSSEVVAKFVNYLDKIAATGTAVIYCHHHTKGSQGQRDAIDRGSGSGVFARDADAIVDMVRLDITEEEKLTKLDNSGDIPIRMEFILRGFKPINPIDMVFRYPVHILDNNGLFANDYAKGDGRNNLKEAPNRKNAITFEDLELAYMACSFNGQVKVSNLANYMDKSEKAIRENLEKYPNRFARDKKTGTVKMV